MEFLTDYFKFLKQRKKYWLIPLFFVLILLSLVVVITASSALAPFIYTLF